MCQIVVVPVQFGVESLFHELDDGAFGTILELESHVLVLSDPQRQKIRTGDETTCKKETVYEDKGTEEGRG